MIYVVLGVGFSGTTLVSELMHHADVSMIDDAEDKYDSGGKYEHPEFQDINRELLRLKDDRVYKLRPSECPAGLTKSQRSRMIKLVERQQSRYDNWGFKDPRSVVTYPLWREILPQHRVIAIYRDPAGNWPRHRWRGLRYRFTNGWRAYIHLRQWCEYNEAILRYGRGMEAGFLLLNYEKLMEGDREMDRLSTFIGKRLEDRRKTSLYRSRSTEDLLYRVTRYSMTRLGRYCPASIGELLEHTHSAQLGSSQDLL